MKLRIGLAALAAGALALGLVAPGVATAAPKAEKPSGKALVRIDTGIAITKVSMASLRSPVLAK